MAEANKHVFETINNGVNRALRDEFGPVDESRDGTLPAKVAVALLQLSLFYFSQTGAPKEVVREFFEKLIGDNPDAPAPELKQEGSLIYLPGQRPGRRG